MLKKTCFAEKSFQKDNENCGNRQLRRCVYLYIDNMLADIVLGFHV